MLRRGAQEKRKNQPFVDDGKKEKGWSSFCHKRAYRKKSCQAFAVFLSLTLLTVLFLPYFLQLDNKITPLSMQKKMDSESRRMKESKGREILGKYI